MTSCLILAAGEGSRLAPLTNDRPKAMVPLLGKPLIVHQINLLTEMGISNVGICTGYKAEQFESLGYPCFQNIDYDSTNMVESLFAARTFLEGVDDDLLISYGDIVYEKKNLTAVLDTCGGVVVMVDELWLDLWSVRHENPLTDAETLKYGANSAIIELGKQPVSLEDVEGQYTGLIKVSKHKVRELISFYDSLDRNLSYDGKPFQQMYMTSFLQQLIESGWPVTPAKVKNGWLEVDTISDMNTYVDLAKKGHLEALWNPND